MNQIADPLSTNIWHQGWKKSQDLELPDQWARQWDQYTLTLQSSHIWIFDRTDELIWEKAQHGKYTPKLRYQQLCLQHFQENQKWWQKGIWNLKCPLKAKIFTWCTLANKIPTWDHLQKRQIIGLGWCSLCKDNEENTNHLFLSCIFSKQVWEHSKSFTSSIFN